MASLGDLYRMVTHPGSQEAVDAYTRFIAREMEGQKAIAKAEAESRKGAARGESPQGFMDRIDQLRGAVPGDPSTTGLTEVFPTKQQRGVADRYAWGRDIGSQHPIAGPLALAPAVAYDLAKFSPSLLRLGDKVIPHDKGYALTPDDTSSTPSFSHLQALVRGYLAGRKE